MTTTDEDLQRRVAAEVALYSHQIVPSKITSVFHTPRATVEALVKKLPPDIEHDSPQSKQLLRKVSRIVFGDDIKSLPYTDNELRLGMGEYLLGNLSKPEVHERFGVPGTTLKRHLKELYSNVRLEY